MAELWKPITDYENLYEVSNQGRVRSLDRKRNCLGRDGAWRTRLVKGRVLKGSRSGTYRTVSFPCDGKIKTFRIQELVAAAFLGPKPNGMYICHGPKGSFDNSVNNIYYGPPSRNAGEDRVRDGTSNRGEQNPHAKMTAEKVIELRKLAAAGMGSESLGKRFGISRQGARQIIARRTWRHI